MLGAESYEVSEDGLVWTFKLNPECQVVGRSAGHRR